VKQFLLFIIFIGSLCLLNACGSSSPPSPPRPPVADFSVVITPASVSTKVGGTSAPVTVTLNAVNGFTSVVSVTISGFPKGINSSPASLARSYYISTTVTGRSPAIKKTPFPECAARCLLYSTGFTLPFVRFSIKRRFNSVSQAVASLPDSGPRRYRSQISSVTLWSFFSIHSMNSPHAPPSP
jgi:hypothetical protein